VDIRPFLCLFALCFQIFSLVFTRGGPKRLRNVDAIPLSRAFVALGEQKEKNTLACLWAWPYGHDLQPTRFGF